MATITGTAGVDIRIRNEAREITPLLEEFVWTESLIRGGFTWALRLKANVWDEWWDLMLGREQPEIWFRLKAQENGQEQTTGWKRAITDWTKASFSAEPTMMAEIHGADRRLDLLQIPHLKTFKEAKVSDVVSLVAASNGLQSDVVETKGQRTRWQIREDDWSFLRRLSRAAAAVDGRGDTFLYMDEDTLRLVTVQTQAPSVRLHDTASVENRLNSYTVQYHGRKIDRLGGATLRGVGFDFSTKTGIVFDSDGVAAAAYPALSRKVPRRQDGGARHVAVIEDQLSTVEAATRSRWGDLGPRYFSLRLHSRPDVSLKPNAVVEVAATDDPERESVFQGRYPLLEVMHHYHNGAISTTAVGYRREAWEGEEQPTGATADTVQTRDKSQGLVTSAPTTIIMAEELPA